MFLKLFKKTKKPKDCDIKPVVLLVLDGFGIAPASNGNAVTQAKMPNYKKYLSMYPNGELLASGEVVGLPANEEGNSEVGHLTLGVGRTILQSLKRINTSIEEGDFYDNDAFSKAINHVLTNKSKLHVMGLVGSGAVHSSNSHLWALLELCRRKRLPNVYLHLFTDGRDSPPREAEKIIGVIEQRLKSEGGAEIATISGRYFAMDRDRRWERTQKAYEAMVSGKGQTAESPVEAIRKAYSNGQTDEFIEPTAILKEGSLVATINNNDAVIFFNFRIDRPRQLCMAFTMPDFEHLKSFEFDDASIRYEDQPKREKEIISGPTFEREKKINNLFFVTMTEYQKNIPVSAIAFPNQKVELSISEILAQKGLKQLHLTESEKERMVTYYFDGLVDKPFPGEIVKIVPSQKVSTYDKKPEMSLPAIMNEFKKALGACEYHFILMNFANPDMVAHSGNLKATIKALEYVDNALGQVVEETLLRNGVLVITADHGNAEELLSFPTSAYFFTSSQGSKNTEHSNNPVPVLVIGKQFQGRSLHLGRGSLADIAPTLLSIMNLPTPLVMKGRNLLNLTKDAN